jgi:ribose 5-phosphate isomerase B
MKVALGSDHAGFELKEHLRNSLHRSGVETLDLGPGGRDSVDYPDFALRVGKAVASGDCDFGVLVCSTGIGMCVTANKVRGVRAALGYNTAAAMQSRAHVDANVLVFGQKFADPEEAAEILGRWLKTPFEGGRHERRVNKITEYEESS